MITIGPLELDVVDDYSDLAYENGEGQTWDICVQRLAEYFNMPADADCLGFKIWLKVYKTPAPDRVEIQLGTFCDYEMWVDDELVEFYGSVIIAAEAIFKKLKADKLYVEVVYEA